MYYVEFLLVLHDILSHFVTQEFVLFQTSFIIYRTLSVI